MFYLLVGVGPYGVTAFVEPSAEDAAVDAELNEPNGPIVVNADDIRLVIPK